MVDTTERDNYIGEWSTPPRVAKELIVGHDKVLFWINSGQLKAVDVSTSRGQRPRWRIHRDDLADFLAHRAAPPPKSKTRRRRRKPQPEITEYYQ